MTCQSATIFGMLGAGTNNTGNVSIGASTNSTAMPYLITPGQVIVLKAPPGEWIDLHDWWFTVVNANDGLVVIYTP